MLYVDGVGIYKGKVLTVEFQHIRRWNEELTVLGMSTRATVTAIPPNAVKKYTHGEALTGDSELVCSGRSHCVYPDAPNKAVGRRIALTRALRSMPDRQMRAAIWGAYWSKTRPVKSTHHHHR